VLLVKVSAGERPALIPGDVGRAADADPNVFKRIHTRVHTD